MGKKRRSQKRQGFQAKGKSLEKIIFPGQGIVRELIGQRNVEKALKSQRI